MISECRIGCILLSFVQQLYIANILCAVHCSLYSSNLTADSNSLSIILNNFQKYIIVNL